MSEGFPKPPTPIEKEPTRKEKIIALTIELRGSHETFAFPGIDPEAYSKMKATDEEYPGYTTSTDELIERFKNEGAKVALGKNPESGNVFVVPAQSSDIEMDSISPQQLQLTEEMDERLKELILLVRG